MIKMTVKRLWTQQEDMFLKEEVNGSNMKNWVKIAEKINNKFEGQPRSAKQCRQRYINHASTSSQNPFIKQWDIINLSSLFQYYEKYGSKWTQIAQKIPNKSENIVKNKFYCSLRKFVRKLNKFLRSGKNKYKKQIRYQSIIRVLEAFQVFSDFPEQLKAWSLNIRQKIIKFTKICIGDGIIEEYEMQDLASNINKFNLQTRSYKAKKIRPTRAEKQTEDQIFFNSSDSKFNQKNQEEKMNVDKFVEMKNCKEGVQNDVDVLYEQSKLNLKHQNTCCNKSQSFISEEQLYEDFGELANERCTRNNDFDNNTLFEMFSDQNQFFQFDGYVA